jgi:hypothetical protein
MFRTTAMTAVIPMHRYIALAAMALGLMAFTARSARADLVTLNFDTDLNGIPIAPGTVVNTAYPPILTGATFSANAVVHTSGSLVPSLPNFAGSPSFTAPVDVFFATPTDFVRAIDVSFSRFTLTAFDASNNVLGSSTVGTGTSASDFDLVATINTPGIARVEFTTTNQYGFDDFTFNRGPQAVPAPPAVVLAGLGAGCVAVRRYVGRRATA